GLFPRGLSGLLALETVRLAEPPLYLRDPSERQYPAQIRRAAKAVMAVLALIGITGMYLRQVRQTGVLGRVGYLVFGAGYVLMLSTEIIAAFVLPGLAHSSPGYVNNVVVAAAGGPPTRSIGGMQTLFDLTGLTYMVGGLLFGIALF